MDQTNAPTGKPLLRVVEAGLVPYEAALELQRRLASDKKAGRVVNVESVHALVG